MAEGTVSKLKKEFLVERQGKTFALYAGLLDLAHQEGLKAIRTKLLQIPTKENGNMAICFAEVETEKGIFSGIGDASPENVSRMMVPHILRMAETRSKARAMRDAVNVGVAALEELGDDVAGSDEHDEVAQKRASRQDTASPAQVVVVYKIGESFGMTRDDVDKLCKETYEKPINVLSGTQYSSFCAKLQTLKREQDGQGKEEEKKGITQQAIDVLRNMEKKRGYVVDKHAENHRVKHGWPQQLEAFTMEQARSYKDALKAMPEKTSETIEGPTRASDLDPGD
jgi:hypothetical protein